MLLSRVITAAVGRQGPFWLGRGCGLYLTSVNPVECQTQALITNSHSLPSLQSVLMSTNTNQTAESPRAPTASL